MEMTLGTILQITASKHPEREGLIFEDARASYSALNERVNQRANALLKMGISRKDHVATLAPNCMELVETIFAVWRIGAVLVPLNMRLSPGEMHYIIEHSDVTVLLFTDRFQETIHQIKPTLKKVRKFVSFNNPPSPGFDDFEVLTNGQGADVPPVGVIENDPATILYTSGTTGKPKGVVATHKNWVWACANASFLKSQNAPIKNLTVYPLFHAGSIINLCGSIFGGNPLVILKEFDPQIMLEQIQKEKVQRMGNPPTVYNMILQHPDIQKYDLSSVIYLNSGAEVMPNETRKRLSRVFVNAGFVDNYGMTETCGNTTSRSEEYTEAKPYSVGIPGITNQVRVVNSKGQDTTPGEVGEIIVRGPNVMQEYYKDPEKTAEAIRGGWLYTDDLGKMDEDGFLMIVERKKNMIISGGENIYPKEVEDVLYRHPKVVDAAVYGVPDKIWGEKVCAAIVLKAGEQMTVEEIIDFSKQNLASFKKPKFVEFIDALPRNTIGKVQRSELKQKFTENKSE